MAKLDDLLGEFQHCLTQRSSANFVFDAEKILALIHELKDPHCIPVLIGFLNDQETCLEVMWSIVHLVEDFPADLYLHGLLESLPMLFLRAPEWAETLHARVLNSTPDTKSYLKVIAKSSGEQRNAINKIIAHLVKDDAEIESKAKPITLLLEAMQNR